MNTLVPTIRLRNARAWAPVTRLRWAAAALAFAIALGMRFALHPVLGSQYPLLFFAVATVVVHFFLGLGPALLVAVVSLPAGTYFFIPPFNSFDMPSEEDLVAGSMYVFVTVVYMLLVQYLRRAQYQAVLLAEIAESRYLMLLDSESDRAMFEAELQKRNV
jgi:K+-sensing histidine kinase KdpD